ncbi:MAG: cobalamin-binding protein [Zoogloeaceae bacterium]|nr:cobalamin-binding protein [Zoogloeaceae bacterium]
MTLLRSVLMALMALAGGSCLAGTAVLTDDAGYELALEVPARRVVSLAPHITEILHAIGAGDTLAGAAEFSDYPPAARQLPRVGGYDRLDLERIVRLRPDLVLAWKSGNPPTQVDRLRAMGLRVFVTEAETLEDIARLLETFGALTGREARALAAASAYRQRLESLRARYSRQAPVTVFYQIWPAPLMTVGRRQIITQVITLCGGVNIYGHLRSLVPVVSLESVLIANPQAIIAAGMDEARPEWLDDWRRWPRLEAARRGNLFHIPPDLIQRHTPRLLDGAEILCRQIETARAAAI